MSEDKDFKLKWEDFKLDASKCKPFEIKDFDSEDITEQMKGASDFQKAMDKMIKANIRKAKEQRDIMIVEQIINIYNHQYPNYKVYVEITKALILKARELNNKPFTFETTMREIYIEPPILSRNVFNTAYKLGKEKNVKEAMKYANMFDVKLMHGNIKERKNKNE